MNIFVDTSIYRSLHFIFSKHRLAELKESIGESEIRFLTTEITSAEVRNQIEEEALGVRRGINSLLNDAKMLHSFDDYGEVHEKLRELKKTSVERGVAEYQKYLADVKATTIATDAVPTAEIVEQYFRGTAPFGGGRKKHEFPDAFVLAALERWCAENRESVYILSTDPDMKRACDTSEHLHWFPGIPSFLESFTEESAAEALRIRAREAYETGGERIAEMLLEALGSCEIQSDSWYQYSDEVTDYNVEDWEILGRKLVSVDEEQAKFELEVTMTIQATHSIDNPHSAVPMGGRICTWKVSDSSKNTVLRSMHI